MKKRFAYLLGGLIIVTFMSLGILLIRSNKVKGSFQPEISPDIFIQKNKYVREYDILQFLFNSREVGTVMKRIETDEGQVVIEIEEPVIDEPVIEETEESSVSIEVDTPKYSVTKKETSTVANEKEYLPEVTVDIHTDGLEKEIVKLDVEYLSQLPELPTGCEITSLTTVLNYLGYPVSKETMAKKYLPKVGYNEASFRDYFLGDPFSEYSYGCYAGPIVKAANRYLTEEKSIYKAFDYSGSNLGLLLKELEAGNPILIWSTMGMEKPYKSASWNVKGETIEWIAPEHCVVLIGYNLKTGTVAVSDPLRGIITLDIKMVNLRYWQMEGQAVVIKE